MPRKKGQPTKSTIKALPDGTVAIVVNPGQPGATKFTNYLVFRIANLTNGTYLHPSSRKWNSYKAHMPTKDGFVYATVDQLLVMLMAHAEFANDSVDANSADPDAHKWPFPVDSTLIAYEANIRGMCKLPPNPPRTREEILDLVKRVTKCPTLVVTPATELRIKKYVKLLKSIRRSRERVLNGTYKTNSPRMRGSVKGKRGENYLRKESAK